MTPLHILTDPRPQEAGMTDEKLMRLAAEAMAGPLPNYRWEPLWDEYQRTLRNRLSVVARILAAVTPEIERRALQSAADMAEARAIEAEAALWRVAPNVHTVGGNPDPFEGPGETYADAYRRVAAERDALRAENDWLRAENDALRGR